MFWSPDDFSDIPSDVKSKRKHFFEKLQNMRKATYWTLAERVFLFALRHFKRKKKHLEWVKKHKKIFFCPRKWIYKQKFKLSLGFRVNVSRKRSKKIVSWMGWCCWGCFFIRLFDELFLNMEEKKRIFFRNVELKRKKKCSNPSR